MYLALRCNKSTVSDLLIEGYKFLGKNKRGQDVYRLVREEPIVRGFVRRTDLPKSYNSTGFAVVDDSGKVVDQYIRRVGTYGGATEPTRQNVSEFITVNTETRGIKGIHYTESVPKASPTVGTFHVYTESKAPQKGIEWQKVFFDAKTNGELKNVYMQAKYTSPRTSKPLEGRYVYDNREVSISQIGVRKPEIKTPFSPKLEYCRYEAKAPISNVQYPYSISALRNPGFYRQYSGPLKSS